MRRAATARGPETLPAVFTQERVRHEGAGAPAWRQVHPLDVDGSRRCQTRRRRDRAPVIRLRNGALSQLAEEGEHTLCFTAAVLVEANLGKDADNALVFPCEAIDQPLLRSGDRIADARTYGRHVRATLCLIGQAPYLQGYDLLNQTPRLNPPTNT